MICNDLANLLTDTLNYDPAVRNPAVIGSWKLSAGAGVVLGNLESLKGDPGEGYLTSFTCPFKIKWPLVAFVL